MFGPLKSLASLEYPRCDPSGAELLSRKGALVEDDAFDAMLNMWRFNRVEGFTPRLGFYFEDYFDQRLNTSLDIAYGFSDKRLKTDF